MFSWSFLPVYPLRNCPPQDPVRIQKTSDPKGEGEKSWPPGNATKLTVVQVYCIEFRFHFATRRHDQTICNLEELVSGKWAGRRSTLEQLAHLSGKKSHPWWSTIFPPFVIWSSRKSQTFWYDSTHRSIRVSSWGSILLSLSAAPTQTSLDSPYPRSKCSTTSLRPSRHANCDLSRTCLFPRDWNQFAWRR